MKDYFDELGFNTCIASEAEKNIINPKSDAVIFPLPIIDKSGNISGTEHKPDKYFELFSENTIAFGGMISQNIIQHFREKNIKIYDYFSREEVAVKNVVPTVQGILKTILSNIEYTLSGSRCAVLGYGKVGKMTADTLATLGAEVTVLARKKSDIALAETRHHNAIQISEKNDYLKSFQIIINTVPSMIIDRKSLLLIDRNTLIIDIASAPYGVDFEEADRLGIKALLCPSLPGKTAPITAGRILAEGVLNIMKEVSYV